jgi:uncharacterized Zn finger protein
VRAATWWGKAWVRAVEESSYDEADLREGRTLARSGRLGSVGVEAGSALCAVEDAALTRLDLPVLDEPTRAAFVEAVAAEAGRIVALTAGDLPHALVEHAEEAGVELLPFGGELAWSCTCDAWIDPCRHALALGYQLGWLVDADPFVLLALRGLTRDGLLADLHALRPAADDDLDVAAEAAEAAARLLDSLD